MAEVFGNDQGKRGCFAVMLLDASEGRGAQLDMGSGDGEMLPMSEWTDPMLVTGYGFGLSESVQLVKCFGDAVYTYAFGHNPMQSMLTVNFTAFLVNPDNQDMNRRFLQSYANGRVSASKKYAKFSVVGSQVLQGFVVGLQSQSMDPQMSLQNFSVSIQLVEVQGAA